MKRRTFLVVMFAAALMAMQLILVFAPAQLTMTDIHGLPGRSIHPATSSVLPALQGEAALTHVKEQGLYDSFQAAMTAARYRVRPVEHNGRAGLAEVYYAANPAQHLMAAFSPEAVELTPKSQAGEPQWRLEMKLVSYGYGERIVALGAGQLSVWENRIESQRAAAGQARASVTEWYVNRAEGLEQGFTVLQPPLANSGGEPLRLRLAVSGDLRAEMAEDEQTLWLKRSDGERALSYGGLKAWDATGRELGARMQVAGAEVCLEVKNAGAIYPVTIDPTFIEQQKLIASDGAGGDVFGRSVAISGSTIVVGAISDNIGGNAFQGSAYVFERQGPNFVEVQKLIASDGAAGDSFGFSVAVGELGGNFFGPPDAISAPTIVVGALGDDIDGNVNQGSAYIFRRKGQKFIEQKLIASAGGALDFFGQSVAISASTIVVGAVGGGNVNQGSVYVFERQGQTFVEQQELTATDGTGGDFFGISAAISGSTIVVGAAGVAAPSGGIDNQGAAYVFERQDQSFVEQQRLTAGDGAGGDFFGEQVAIKGSTIVVSARFDDIGGNVDQGSAYVFRRQDQTFVEQQKLTASDGVGGDFFGSSVAVWSATDLFGPPDASSGGFSNRLPTIVVGALRGGNVDQGSAYVFRRQDQTFVEQQKLSASDGAVVDSNFGISVAISGSTIVVGTPGADIGGNFNQGSAYVFAP